MIAASLRLGIAIGVVNRVLGSGLNGGIAGLPG
jgi:hypothetical protein